MLDYQGKKFYSYLKSEIEKSKKRLNDKNLTMGKAMEMMNVSSGTMYQYFKSENLSPKTVNKILEAFHTTEEEVFGKQSDVIIHELEKYRLKKGITHKELADDLGLSENVVIDTISGLRRVKDDEALKIRQVTGISLTQNNAGTEYKSQGNADTYVRESEITFGRIENQASSDKSNANYIGEVNDQMDQEGYTKFTEISPGRYRMKVDLVPIYARAGYLAGFGDHQYIEYLPKHEVTVTKYHKGKYMAFDVAGDSMNDGSIDSIPDKSIITGRLVEKDLWRPKLHTHNHRFWIFIHKYEGVLVKMIKSQDMDTGDIVLSSLNPNKDFYPDQKINLADVHQILNVVRIEREM